MDSVRYPPREVSAGGLALTCDFLNRMWEANSSGALNLNGMGLRAVPRYLCEEPMRTRITELSMLQNDITRLPPELGYLARLDVLRIDEAAIAFPPESVMRQHAHLRDDALQALVGAAAAPFMHFLRRVADSARTREMALRGGAWGPEAGGLELRLTVMAGEVMGRTGCRMLDVSRNAIREIPAAVARMTALTALLVHDNRLRYVPDELGALSALQVLSLAPAAAPAAAPRRAASRAAAAALLLRLPPSPPLPPPLLLLLLLPMMMRIIRMIWRCRRCRWRCCRRFRVIRRYERCR